MNRTLKLTCAVLAAAPLAWPAAAWAQNPQGNPQGSVQDFRLEPGEPTPPSDIQGPVDVDAPLRPPTPTPTASPSPPTVEIAPATPTPKPTVAVPVARPTTAAPAASPSPSAAEQPATAPDEAPAPTASPPAFPDLTTPVPDVDATSAPIEAERPPLEEEPASIPIWAWLVAAAAMLAAAAWFLLGRRKPQAPVRLEPAPRPRPRPQPEPEPEAASPAASPFAGGLNLQLTPRSLSASLFNATLQYRIELENAGPESLGPIAIAGDMTAAHASRSPQEQLAAIGQDLAEMHRVEKLQPGERTELTGEIRLPLSAITPIRKGRAMLFVPLVRIYALDSAGGAVIGGGTFVVGEPPTAPGGRLRPFRLDLGPRVYPTVEQRKLAMPDAMPLDGRAMAS